MRQRLRYVAAIGLLGCCVAWLPDLTAAQGGTPSEVDAEVFATVVRDLGTLAEGRRIRPARRAAPAPRSSPRSSARRAQPPARARFRSRCSR